MIKRMAQACALFLLTVWMIRSVSLQAQTGPVPEMSPFPGTADSASLAALNTTQADLYIGSLHARGTLYDVSPDGLVAVTAKHLFDHAEEQGGETDGTCRVVFANGMSAEAALIGTGDTEDIAFIRIDAARLTKELTDGLSVVRPYEENAFSVKEGDSVLASSGEGDFRVGEVAYASLHIASAGGEMLCCYLSADPGMSGGGVFDVYGNLLGIISMGSSANETLVTPADIVSGVYHTLVK